MRFATTPLRRFHRLGLLALLLTMASGCGGSGSGGDPSPRAELGFRILWERPDSGAAAETAPLDEPIPGAVGAIRFTFTSLQSGESCCIAIVRGSTEFAERRITLADVPPGNAQLGLRAYLDRRAPSDGITTICPTRPLGQGSACAGSSADSHIVFDSDLQPVNLLAGFRNQVFAEAFSLPFLLSSDPADGETAQDSPPTVRLVVADAAHPVDPEVGIRIAGSVASADAQILDLQTCDERPGASDPDCSAMGDLDIQGVLIVARPERFIGSGAAEVRVRASNLASPARDLDRRYDIFVPAGLTTTTFNTSTLPPTTTSTFRDTTTTTGTPPTTTSTTTSTLPSTTTTTNPPPTTTSTSSTTTTTLDPGLVESCVEFVVIDSANYTGISFEADYSSLDGSFVGFGPDVDCAGLVAGSVAAFRDDDEISVLRIGIADSSAFSGPASLATCRFRGSEVVDEGLVTITVVEATDANLNPAVAHVVIGSEDCLLMRR